MVIIKIRINLINKVDDKVDDEADEKIIEEQHI